MRYVLLFIPFLLSLACGSNPVLRYSIAWTGSFVILWLSLSGRIRPLPGGLPVRYQLLRPIVFTQVIFATYTALTSIFYFVLATGRSSSILGLPNPSRDLAAQAQMYYVLAHASVTTGMLLFASYSDSGLYRLRTTTSTETLLLRLAFAFFIGMLLVARIPLLSELTVRLRSFALAASVCSFALCIIRRRTALLLMNGVVFVLNFLLALLSGWKEEVIILLAWFGMVLYPYHRRATIAFATMMIVLFVLFMPAYTTLYRTLAWANQIDPAMAMQQAYRYIKAGNVNIELAVRSFLVVRVSEISLFVGYLDQVPRVRPFYGAQILEQTGVAFVPRILWRKKPLLEPLIMERVYQNGIVSRTSAVSAKPQFVVDGYLTAGAVGVFITCLLYGMLATLASRVAERWFGGYLLGSGLVYSALFQVFWRGNSFEMFFPTVFWSFMVMGALFVGGRTFGVLVASPAAPPRASLAPPSDAQEGEPIIVPAT